MKVNNISYLYDTGRNYELILCDNSKLSYPLHNHISVFTIGIVLDGSILLSTNNTTQLCNKNQAFVIPPYVPHSIKANDTYSLLCLCVRKDLIHCSSCDTDKIMFNLKNLLAGASGTNRINAEHLSGLLSCLYFIKDVYSVSASSINDPYIDRLIKQLELFPENKFSVEEMAHSALTSKYGFIRRFKQTVGLTPHQFQLQNRIRKAKRLISKADTITEVALTTGFCDQSHFIKQFEKHVGLTPSVYKLSAGIFDPYTAS